MRVQKSALRQDTEIDILELDIHAALKNDKLDLEAIHKLVDQNKKMKSLFQQDWGKEKRG